MVWGPGLLGADDYVDIDVAYLLGMLFGRGQLIEGRDGAKGKSDPCGRLREAYHHVAQPEMLVLARNGQVEFPPTRGVPGARPQAARPRGGVPARFRGRSRHTQLGRQRLGSMTAHRIPGRP